MGLSELPILRFRLKDTESSAANPDTTQHDTIVTKVLNIDHES